MSERTDTEYLEPLNWTMSFMRDYERRKKLNPKFTTDDYESMGAQLLAPFHTSQSDP